MVNEPPKVCKEGRYNVKETAAILGVSARTIRRHTEAHLINCGYRKSNGLPFYLGSEILRYWGAEY